MSNKKTKIQQKHILLKIPIPVHSDVLKVQAFRKLQGESQTLRELMTEMVEDAMTLPKHREALTFKGKGAAHD